MTQQDEACYLAPLTAVLSRADLPTTLQPPTVLFSLLSSASLQDRGEFGCGLANIPARWSEEGCRGSYSSTVNTGHLCTLL